jgi:hypothetical protein
MEKEINVMKRWLLIITLLIAAGLATACGTDGQKVAPQAAINQGMPVTDGLSPDEARPSQSESAQVSSAAPTFATQSNSEKAVGVDVTPLNLTSGGATLEFEVAFNTHSVDLSFDPAAISILRDGTGREYPAVAWEGSGPGGHHRSGVLRFQMPEAASDSVELVIQGVAGVPERVFHWDLTQ